jgi:hypothetical protein
MSIPKSSEVNTENVIDVTMEDLNDTQKQLLQKAIDEYQQACLRTFSSTRKGEVTQKTAFPKLREIIVTEDTVKFQEMFDQAMHHAMINQSSILMNSVQHAFRETMAGNRQMGYKGPCYFQPESSATAGARAENAAMTGIGTQPVQPNVVQAEAGGYRVPHSLHSLGNPLQTAPVFTPSMEASLAPQLVSPPIHL